MASMHCFVLLLIQVSYSFAAAPLRCLLRESEFFSIFSKTNIPASFHDIYKMDPPQLEPMKFDIISFDQDDLHVITKELEYTGFSDAILDEFAISFNSNLTRIFVHADIALKGLYQLEGSLFALPIMGEGSFKGFFKNMKIEILMPFEITTDENGRKYIDLKRFYFWQDITSNSELFFTNLYNGNKEQSDVMHSLINQNMRVIAQYFGKPFMSKIVGRIFTFLKNYMLSMPLKDFTAC